MINKQNEDNEQLAKVFFSCSAFKARNAPKHICKSKANYTKIVLLNSYRKLFASIAISQIIINKSDNNELQEK